MLIKPFKPLSDIVITPSNDKKVSSVKNTIYFRNNGGATEEITSGTDYVDMVLECELIGPVIYGDNSLDLVSELSLRFVRICYYFTGIIDYKEHPSIFGKKLSVKEQLKYTRLYLQQAVSFGAIIPDGSNTVFTIYRAADNSVSTVMRVPDTIEYNMDNPKRPPFPFSFSIATHVFNDDKENLSTMIKFPYADISSNQNANEIMSALDKEGVIRNIAYDIVNPLYPRIVEVPTSYSDSVRKDAFVSEISKVRKIFTGDEFITNLLNLSIVNISNNFNEIQKRNEELRRMVMSSNVGEVNPLVATEVDMRSAIYKIMYMNLPNSVQTYLKEIELIYDMDFRNTTCGVKRIVSPIKIDVDILSDNNHTKVYNTRDSILAYNTMVVAEAYRAAFYTVCSKVLRDSAFCLDHTRITIHDSQFETVIKMTLFNDKLGKITKEVICRMTKNELIDDYIMHKWMNVDVKKHKKLSMLGGH